MNKSSRKSIKNLGQLGLYLNVKEHKNLLITKNTCKKQLCFKRIDITLRRRA